MALDPFSPISPARVRALALPVGRIKRTRFEAFLSLLQSECMVNLGAISPDTRPDRTMFSPVAFPQGYLFYDLSPWVPPISHEALAPFELFREPLIVIALADAIEYDGDERTDNGVRNASDDGRTSSRHDRWSISSDLLTHFSSIKDHFPRAVIQKLFYFDYDTHFKLDSIPEDIVLIPQSSQRSATSMKTAMCDLGASFLAELMTLAKSIQAISSPAMSKNPSIQTARRWTFSSSSELGRSNSAAGFYSESSAFNTNRNVNRMSMPVQSMTSQSTNGSPALRGDIRPSTPSSGPSTPPPTSFDEIGGAVSPTDSKNADGLPLKTRPASSSRTMSSERVSVHGFGSGSVLERDRNKGKSRIGIIVGSLHLCAGQWQNAMRQLIENAEQARLLSDHLWHAKALENILVCLVLLAWANVDFQVRGTLRGCVNSWDFINQFKQIPQICIADSDRSISLKASMTNSDAQQATGQRVSSVTAQSLKMILPGLVNNILSLYVRASHFQGEELPSVAFSEVSIRLCKLLGAVHICGGIFTDQCLQYAIRGVPLEVPSTLNVSRVTITPSRQDIATILFKALPSHSETFPMAITDRTRILAGVASVLSSIGMHRKKAVVLKEFVELLIPALVQARKVGAAELGVHPAAGFSALNLSSGAIGGSGPLGIAEAEYESGVDQFLNVLCAVYGASVSDQLSAGSKNNQLSDKSGSTTRQAQKSHQGLQATDAYVKGILDTTHSRHFGNSQLKLDILRLCVNFCEALPDFQGILHFVASLLRFAGPGNAPGANSTEVFVALPRDEQIRLSSKISRTVDAIERSGLEGVETRYWDDFLVRGLRLVGAPQERLLSPHGKSDLDAITSSEKDKNPFIHSTFTKKPEPTAIEYVIVAGENYEYVVALQNPYDFEVEIESLALATHDLSLVSDAQPLRIGPYRTQKFTVNAIANSAGKGSVDGCVVKVKGCQVQKFPIFTDAWSPESNTKPKTIGLQAINLRNGSEREQITSALPNSTSSSAIPRPTVLSLTVIPRQPQLAISEVSLSQSVLMVLEGEKKRFDVTVTNVSDVVADFVHFSVQDSATTALQNALNNKDLPASELHELQVQLAENPALSWIESTRNESVRIEPGTHHIFSIEVVGKPGLNEGTLIFDYANLGEGEEKLQKRFFTRQVTVHLNFTVNANVQLNRLDILPYTSDLVWKQDNQDSSPEQSDNKPVDHEKEGFATILHRSGLNTGQVDNCIVLFDLRNVWPNPLQVSFNILDPNNNSSKRTDHAASEVIQPGHVSRMVLVLPKILIKNVHAAIPSLDPSKQKQFVVSASNVPPELELNNREAFWYREELLKRIKGTWEDHETGRRGSIQLRSLRLNPRMVDAMRLDEIDIQLSISADDNTDTNEQKQQQPQPHPHNIRQTGRSAFQVPVDTFFTLQARVTNRSDAPIHPLLRLQPSLANLPHTIALDLDKKLSCSGVLQRPLAALRPGASALVRLGMCALCSGVFEVGATVEEIRVWSEDEDEDDDSLGKADKVGEKTGRARSNTAALQDTVLGVVREKRVWHAREACTVVAAMP